MVWRGPQRDSTPNVRTCAKRTKWRRERTTCWPWWSVPHWLCCHGNRCQRPDEGQWVCMWEREREIKPNTHANVHTRRETKVKDEDRKVFTVKLWPYFICTNLEKSDHLESFLESSRTSRADVCVCVWRTFHQHLRPCVYKASRQVSVKASLSLASLCLLAPTCAVLSKTFGEDQLM